MPTTDERGPKERVYDDRISPLMAQIIATCKATGLACVASFGLDGDLLCTTHIPGDGDTDPETAARFERARRQIVAPRVSSFVAYTITTRTP